MNEVSAPVAAMQDRPWLQHYPPGVPADIDPAQVGTLVDLFRSSVAAYASRPAYESFGARLTYADLKREAEAFASWLQGAGMKKGDRVAIMMPNVLAFPVAMFGALIAGCTVVNVNPLYTPRELEHQLNDSGARVLVALENFAVTVQHALPRLNLDRVLVAAPGDLMGFKGFIVTAVSRYVKKAVPAWDIPGAIRFTEALSQGRGKSPASVTVSGDDLAFLQYTGGTTGVSKGAMLTHANVASNVLQAYLWFNAGGEGEADPVMVTALPLYHIFALTACCLFMLKSGGCSLLIANPRDIDGFVKTLKGARFTRMSGVNTLYNALAHHPQIRSVDFSHLAFSVAGGMATQAPVAKLWKEITGKPILEGYGLSETSPVVTTNPPTLEEFSGTIGYPMPSTWVVIRDAANNDLPTGEPGELCVKGPQVMPGYWNRPDETARVMTPDGYFRTGDVAVMQPDGQFRIVDRAKDMILVSGFNVYPNEVEEVLAGHPGVLEAAVVGAPDDNSGERVVAYVVKREESLTEEDVRAFAKERLAAYKAPKQVIFRAELPKTNVGKVLRRALRDGG
ncbi:long-chain acyl-CoA synthetase [Camelimonas lactis]|uniref:Long-chain-fatty-acid--CoA ligase n=2 Tax=Camelimonas lactis TaxID=659006 RepID=A0A4R2GVX4_9HYPH|nr:AMP-binding protein [Camelimonas lactis]TCO13415.1 long-chain acyl-CoA synthetase [Camelimonas lactis]